MSDGSNRHADRVHAGVARRDFLKTSARATGALLALGAPTEAAALEDEQNRPRPATWSQSKRVPSNLISLPKSGAAVAGLGETFVPNPQTGTEGISIPIPLSKGRDGFGPQLSLSYSVANGNGPFGMGWKLEMPEVARGTQTRLPRYRDDDVLLLDGAELRAHESFPPVGRGGYEVHTYRLRHEGPFSRIERWVRPSPDARAAAPVSFWRVTSKDNVTQIFGATDEGIVADPSEPGRVFRWALQLAYDGKGNVVHYVYKREDGAGVEPHERDRAVAQTYLKRIRYGNLSPLVFPTPADAVRSLASGWDASMWFFEAALDYGEHRRTDAGDSIVTGDMDEERETWRVRDDAFSSFRSGFEIRTRRVCTRVLMFHRVPGASRPSLVGSLDLVMASPTDRRGFQTVTLLKEAIRRGYAPCASGAINDSEDYEAGTGRGVRSGSYCISSVPPLAFCYSGFDPPTSDDQMTLQGEGNAPTEGLSEGNLALVDLFQRGLPDILRTGGSEYFYWKNQGGGRFASQASLGAAPRGARPRQPVILADRRVGFGELTSDGFPDLLVDTRGAGCCVGRRGSPSEPPRWLDYQPFVARLPFQLTDGNIRLIDLNGDGLLDILRSTSRHFELFESDGQRGFKKPQIIPRGALDRFPNVDFDDPRVHFADMTGDGLVDIVLIAQREIHYWPNLGFGRFGRRVTMRHSPPGPFERGRLYFIDIDGSGPADLVYVDSGRVECWLNRAGNEWTDRFFVNDTPRLIDEPPQPVDLLGSGITGLLWSSSSGLKGYSYLPLSRKKPFLLTRVDNGMGRRVEYTYEPSTKFALKAGADTPWDEPLPFPVYVLSRIERHDDITRSRLVSTFSYAHGAYDSAEKAFKGFGRVDQEDTEYLSAQAPLPPGSDPLPGELHLTPVLTKTWFHTGSHLPDTKVKRYAKEYYAADPLSLPPSSLPPPVSPLLDEEASRSLAGRLLRREIWALSRDPDGPHPAHPYIVSEWSFDVRRLQGGADGGNAVHHVRQSQELRIHYELRPDDPQVAHEFNLLFDKYGHVLESAAVSYPRHPVPERLPEQGRALATYTVRTYASREADAGGFRHGVISDEQSYELVNLAAGATTVLAREQLLEWFRGAVKTELDAEPQPGIRQARLIAHTRHCFWSDEGAGPLRAGQVGLLALPHNTYRKALTPGLLGTVYGSGVDEALAREGGYQRDEHGAWWAPDGDPRAERGSMIFDLQHFCLPVQWNDPLGRTSSARYDPCWLAPVETTDPLDNVTTAEVDYYTLLPKEIQDFNRNRTFLAFDALGRVAGTAVAGRADATAGDSLRGFQSNLDHQRVRAYLDDPLSRGPALLGEATTRTVHDVWAYSRARKSGGDGAASPPVICTLARETHVADLAAGTSSPVQHTFVYRDGFGRELQTKARAAPGVTSTGRRATARWIGSGATLYDNKGNAIKKYEPFFSSTHRFDTDAALTRWGVTPVFHHDPLGRLIRTNKPDGTFTRVTLAPWHQERWDEVDTVLESAWERDRAGSEIAAGRRAAELSRRHARTPLVTHFDGLQRAFLTISDNGPLGRYSTHTTLDIQGNATRVTDPRGNTCAASDFDMLGRLLRTRSIDSGDRSRLPNAWGDPIREWDGAGRLVRRTYDALNRPAEVFVRRDNEAERLVERFVYGEGVPGAEARGLRGELHEVHTEAGYVRTVAFDFKRNIKESTQTLWRPGQTTIGGRSEADAETFSRASSYDALNRPIAVLHPDGSTTETAYDEGGNVRRVQVQRGGTSLARVDNVEYNARRQRTLLVYGNGVRVENRYDRETFRLSHVVTVRPDGTKLQDMSYTYDAAGNVVEIVDRAQDVVFFKNEPVEPKWLFEYDAVYRLTVATGREHASLGLPSAPDRRPAPVSVPSPPPRGRGAARSHPNDGQALTKYCEEYTYDPAGNLLLVRHRNASGGWTQRYEYPLTSNRLAACGRPDRMETYSHDGNGNVATMPHAKRIEWDYADRMRVYGEGDTLAFYAYDVEGARVRKTVERGPLADDRISLGDYERFERRRKEAPELARHTTHVRLGEVLVACVESETRRDGRALASAASRTRFQLHDHLASGRLEVDETGALVSYEEYHPFGTSAYRAGPSAIEVSRKRFRYRGKELDEESGLYYFGARSYAPWLGRWVSCDPLGLQEGPNLYAYTANNPIRFVDAKGLSRSDHQKLYGMTSSDAPQTVAPQSEPEPSSTSVSDTPDARPPEDSEPRETAGMTDPDSPASVAALSLGASVPDGADAAGAPAEPRAEERDVATPSERAAENWFSGIQTTVDFGAAFTDPVTGASMGAIGEASAAEGVLNKGHKSEEKRLIIEKVGSREVQGWGIGAGLTVSWIQQKIDPSLIDKGPRISDKSDFRFPIGRGKGRIGNDNVALDVKVSFLSVKLRWGPEHREIGVGVSKGGLVAFTTRGRVETTIRTAPPMRYTGGSWDAPR